MADLPRGQRMWLAFSDQIEAVTVVAKGDGGRVLKQKIKQPYLVKDEDDEEFVVGYADLCDSRLCADRKRLELRAEFGFEDEDEEDFDEDDFDEDD